MTLSTSKSSTSSKKTVAKTHSSKIRSNGETLAASHPALVHTKGARVVSHTQREIGEWIQHTVMLHGHDVPFKFRRTRKYKSLQDQRVNLTYYPETETVAGFEIEIMKVVRIKRD